MHFTTPLAIGDWCVTRELQAWGQVGPDSDRTAKPRVRPRCTQEVKRSPKNDAISKLTMIFYIKLHRLVSTFHTHEQRPYTGLSRWRGGNDLRPLLGCCAPRLG